MGIEQIEKDFNVKDQQIVPLTRFTRSPVLWLIFGKCWCNDSDARVESTCRNFALPYVQLINHVNEDFIVRLSTEPAAIASKKHFRNSKDLRRASHHGIQSNFKRT